MAFLVSAAASCGFVWSFWSLWDCQKKVETAIQQLEGHLQQCPQCDSNLEEEVRRELNPEDDISIETGQISQSIHTEATGRVVKNPFFNYLREIRPTMTGQRQTVIAIEGARRWNQLPLEQKRKYCIFNVLPHNYT